MLVGIISGALTLIASLAAFAGYNNLGIRTPQPRPMGRPVFTQKEEQLFTRAITIFSSLAAIQLVLPESLKEIQVWLGRANGKGLTIDTKRELIVQASTLLQRLEVSGDERISTDDGKVISGWLDDYIGPNRHIRERD